MSGKTDYMFLVQTPIDYNRQVWGFYNSGEDFELKFYLRDTFVANQDFSGHIQVDSSRAGKEPFWSLWLLSLSYSNY